jgi:hypothetical protein
MLPVRELIKVSSSGAFTQRLTPVTVQLVVEAGSTRPLASLRGPSL